MRRNFTPSAFITGLPDSVTAEASFVGTNTVAVVLAGIKRVRHKLLIFVYGARKRVKKVSII